MAKTAMPDTKRLNIFEADADDPRIVIVGIDQTERYGEGICEKTRRHPCFDKRAFDPIEGDPDLMGTMDRIERFGYDPSQPVNVWKDGDFYLVRAGRGRLRTSRALTKKHGKPVRVTFYVSKGTEESAFVSKIGENANRRPLAPTQMAELMHEAMHVRNFSLEDTAIMFGVPQEVVNRRLLLLDLSEPMRAKVDSKEVALRVAEELSKLARDEQEPQLEALKAQGITTQDDQYEALRQLARAREKQDRGAGGEDEPSVQSIIIAPKKGEARKIAAKFVAGELKIPGVEKMTFMDGVRWMLGEIDDRKIKGMTAARREVMPQKRQRPAEAEESGTDDGEGGDDDGQDD